MRPTLRLVVLTLLTMSAPFLVRAQDTLHGRLTIKNNAAGGSRLLFPGEKMDVILTAVKVSTEHGISVTRDQGPLTIAASKWMVNGVVNGNATCGRIVQKSTGYALYTAPDSYFYGPITVSASMPGDDLSEETSLAPVFYIIPKHFRYTYYVAVGCSCAEEVGPIPRILNSQGMEIDFKFKRTSDDDVAETDVERGPTALPTGPEHRHGEACDPAFILSKLTWGKDLAMTDPHCTYFGSDNRLHFQIAGHNPDFPGWEVRASATNGIILEMPLAESKETKWEPQLNITKLPFESPPQKTKLPGGMRLQTKWQVEVLQ